MACGCNGKSEPSAGADRFEVRLPDGTVKVVGSETDAKIEITMAGGGTFTRI